MVISTNPKPTIYRKLYENRAIDWLQVDFLDSIIVIIFIVHALKYINMISKIRLRIYAAIFNVFVWDYMFQIFAIIQI